MENKPIYKITFYDQSKIYELYAHSVHHGGLFGFIEVEDLIFDEKSSLVVDPSEETLKSKFSDVLSTYLPMHTVIRIDKVAKKGTAKISDAAKNGDNVMPFPLYAPPGDIEKK